MSHPLENRTLPADMILTALGPGPGFRMLMPDWRGYVVAFFSLVLVANAYLNLFNRLRLEITQTKSETKKLETEARSAQVKIDRLQRSPADGNGGD